MPPSTDPPAPLEPFSTWLKWTASALLAVGLAQAPFLPHRPSSSLLSWAAALAAGFALALTGRLILIRGAAMAAALIALGTCPTWWSASLAGGTAAVHAALLAASFSLLVRWHHTDRHLLFSTGLLLYSLSYGLGQPSLLFLPALVYLVGKTGWRRLLTPARAAWVLLCTALAILLAIRTGPGAYGAAALGLDHPDTLAGHLRHAVGNVAAVLLEWRALLPLVLLGLAYLPSHDPVTDGAATLFLGVPLAVLCFSRLADRSGLVLLALAPATLHLAATGGTLLDWGLRRKPLPGARRLAVALVLLLVACSIPATVRTVQTSLPPARP